MGVSLFFVLSGFLIGIRYSATFEHLGLVGWRNFALHRFVRIYPVYFLVTVPLLLYKQNTLATWVANLFLVQGFFEELSYTGIGIGWSLTVEVCFYALAPVVLLTWNKIGLWGWTFIALGAGLLLVALGQIPLPYQFVPSLGFMVRGTFFGRCFEFFFGVWVAKFLLAKGSPKQTGTGPSIFTHVGTAGIVATMLAMAYVRGDSPRAVSTEQAFYFNALNNFLLPLFIGSLLWGLAQEKSILKSLLGSKLGQALGKGSYIFYLIHYKAYILYQFHVRPTLSLPNGHEGLENLLVLFLVAAASIIGYHLLEVPLQRWLLQKSLRPRPKTSHPS